MSVRRLVCRALCLLSGHRPYSQRTHVMRSSHVRCQRCDELIRAPIEPAVFQ